MSAINPHLLAPLELGFTALRNRVVMGSMNTSLKEQRDFQDDLVVAGMKLHLIGGDDKASEVDALHTMGQGV